jgi:hypothetical protein
VVKAVIASEIVHQYADGWAYKPADELEKATWTADGRWVKSLSHPQGPSIINVRDVHGRMENPVFRKDLIDPKTKRPCRRGIEVDIRFFKDRTEADVLEKVRKGELRDNSIGFSCDKDWTGGEFQGKHYDYVQRNILIDHLAAPIVKGRCPAPYCGINVDSVEADVWEENEDSIRSGHGDKAKFDKDSFRTIDITGGVKAVVACPKGKYENGKCTVGMESQSFIFDKTKFTVEQAKAWFEKHHAKDSAELTEYFDCPVCRSIDDVGPLEAGRRLLKQYGADVLEVIEGHKPPTTVNDEMTLLVINSKIDELYDKKDGLMKQQRAMWSANQKSIEVDPEQAKLSRELEDLDLEIRAFKELKIKRIVEGNGAKPEAPEKKKDADEKDDALARNRKALQDIKVYLDVF